jgi:hypothetical protein
VDTAVAEVGAFEDNKEDLEIQDEIEGRVRWLLGVISEEECA